MWTLIFLFFNLTKLISADLCSVYFSEVSKYYVACGWDSCLLYRTVIRSRSVCCSGYDHYPNCYPICNSRTVLEGACDEAYISDKIVYRGGTTRNSGEGTCTSPNTCANCQDGFYASGGRCLICPAIPNCNHRRCSSPSDNFCNYCQYEIKDKRYWRGYTKHNDGQMKECRKTCSWRSDSTRYLPGECSNETVESCICTSGFGGNQCDQITEETSIMYAAISLIGWTNDKDTFILDPSNVMLQSPLYTNKADLNSMEIEFQGQFVASGTPPQLDPYHFVTEFRYGIVFGQMKLHFIQNALENALVYTCPSTEDFPINVNFTCSKKGINQSDINMPAFGHGEQINFTIDVRNGGYLKYMDRETNRLHRVSLTGKTTTRTYTVQWDYETPYYQCLKTYGSQCRVPVINIQDVTDKNSVPFSWKSWIDDLAGIDLYQYEVFYLTLSNKTLLKEGKVMTLDRTSPSFQAGTVNVTSPGMYFIILTAIDKAKNRKSSRSVFLFDNQSKVETVQGTRMFVPDASSATNYTWVVNNTDQLRVTWSGRFMNRRHNEYGFLLPVASYENVETLYDDMYGRRTVEGIKNVKGVVRFDINFTIYGQNIKSSQGYTVVSDIYAENDKLNVTWKDGEKIDISVKATDILGKSSIDTITLYKDTTPPVIQNLWLTDGNHTDMFYHSSTDFTTLTFEWDSFDYHSGLSSVQWKLFDNSTGQEINHGFAILRQHQINETSKLCQEWYDSTQKGQSCYCTMYHGCFQKHFHIQPKISNDFGLLPGKELGFQGFEYYIEITAINKALLNSVQAIKITIDITAPQSGYVHDGVRGDSEIDYQQELQLSANWGGYVDPESGVSYYKYIFAKNCFTKRDLINTDEGFETHFGEANFTAVKQGTYFVTVIATNKANSASSAVCSDGVTITTTIPTVKDIVLSNAKTYPRLVKDSREVFWIIDKNVNRVLTNTSYNCSNIFTELKNVELIPVIQRTEIDCTELLSQAYQKLVVVLARSSELELSWQGDIVKEITDDYEIALSSMNQSFPPDISLFQSTQQNEHYRINSSLVSAGEMFYILIKSSKSNVEGIQSYGPVVIDDTAPIPTESHIGADFMNGAVIAHWSSDIFEDDEDPYPLTYQYAVGQEKGGTEVVNYRQFSFNKDCIQKIPPVCTVIDFIEWNWHSQYYITIKAANLAGLTSTWSSEVYTHEVPPPTPGVVVDVKPESSENTELQDMNDVDYSVITERLSVLWKDFYHPYLPVYYIVCVRTLVNVGDVTGGIRVDGNTSKNTFYNLTLKASQTYYITVKAVTAGGSTKVSSDGVTILDNSSEIVGLLVRDVSHCSAETFYLNGNEENNMEDRTAVVECEKADIDYQTSVTSLSSSWYFPDIYGDVVDSAFLRIDRKSAFEDMWEPYSEYINVFSNLSAIVAGIQLQSGLTYRTTVKLCASDVCFRPSHSDGVMVIPNKPVTDSLAVSFKNFMIRFQFQTMYDPDIQNRKKAIAVVSRYEWIILDLYHQNSTNGTWNVVDNLEKMNETHSMCEVSPCGKLDISTCNVIKLRGYNKAGNYAEVNWTSPLCIVVDKRIESIQKISVKE